MNGRDLTKVKLKAICGPGDTADPVITIMLHENLIFNKIYVITGKMIMLDRDLAELNEVETKALNQPIKRNASRFPDDFMFQLSKEEYDIINQKL